MNRSTKLNNLLVFRESALVTGVHFIRCYSPAICDLGFGNDDILNKICIRGLLHPAVVTGCRFLMLFHIIKCFSSVKFLHF